MEETKHFLHPPNRRFRSLKYAAPSGGRPVANTEGAGLKKGNDKAAMEGLEARLKNPEYTNWFKASLCLTMLGEGLMPFINQHMKAFHTELLSNNSVLGEPCRSSCAARGTTVRPPPPRVSHTCLPPVSAAATWGCFNVYERDQPAGDWCQETGVRRLCVCL